MKRKAPWIAAIAFSAFSMTAFAAEGDSPRSEAGQQEQRIGDSPPPGGEMPEASTNAPSGIPSFSQADADSNGELDQSEAAAAGVPFSGADRNTDGRLTFDEYETAAGQTGGD